MPINSIMKKHVVAIGPSETVAAAARRMSENNLGALLVVENDKLLAIFSERDLLIRVVAPGRDPSATIIRDVATLNPVTVSASADLATCYRIIKEQGFRHLPVVSETGRPIGVISSRDFLQLMVLRIEESPDMAEFYKNITKMNLNIYGN